MGYGFGNCGSTGGYKKNCQSYSGYGNTFTLIVVLFILLIIVGASFY